MKNTIFRSALLLNRAILQACVEAFFISVLTVSCGFQNFDLRDIDQTKLVGSWSGIGRFYQVKYKNISIPFVVRFNSDLSCSGSVGGATLENVKIKKKWWGTRWIEVKATLNGRIHEHPTLAKKDHLILMISSLTDSTMGDDFHLQSNLVFDITMGIGGVTFKRMP